jgi:hypothetical protein
MVQVLVTSAAARATGGEQRHLGGSNEHGVRGVSILQSLAREWPIATPGKWSLGEQAGTARVGGVGQVLLLGRQGIR